MTSAGWEKEREKKMRKLQRKTAIDESAGSGERIAHSNTLK